MLNRDYRHEMKPAIGAFGHSYHAFLHSKRVCDNLICTPILTFRNQWGRE